MDVIFYETIFPFKNKETEKDPAEVENENTMQDQNIETITQDQEKQLENQNERNLSRPIREKRKPTKLDNYICYNITKYPINKYLGFNNFSEKHKTFLTKKFRIQRSQELCTSKQRNSLARSYEIRNQCLKT